MNGIGPIIYSLLVPLHSRLDAIPPCTDRRPYVVCRGLSALVKRKTAWENTRPHISVLIRESSYSTEIRFLAWTREYVLETEGGHTAEGVETREFGSEGNR